MPGRTTVAVPWRAWWTANVRGALHYNAIRLKRDLLGADDPWLGAYDRFKGNKQRGALDESEIRAITDFQVRQVGSDYASRAKGGLSLSQQQFLDTLADLIRNHDLRSAANIGARVDHYSARLAAVFPQVEFYSVDFQPDLARHNAGLEQRPNWHFRTGYPLNLIRDGRVKAELYFFVSTSVLMNNVELDLYFDAMAPHTRAFAFCEGWWPSAEHLDFRVRRPETIPVDNPYCGGEYANYHHNYVAKLERRGYRIAASRIAPESAGYHYLQLFAIKA